MHEEPTQPEGVDNVVQRSTDLQQKVGNEIRKLSGRDSGLSLDNVALALDRFDLRGSAGNKRCDLADRVLEGSRRSSIVGGGG